MNMLILVNVVCGNIYHKISCCFLLFFILICSSYSIHSPSFTFGGYFDCHHNVSDVSPWNRVVGREMARSQRAFTCPPRRKPETSFRFIMEIFTPRYRCRILHSRQPLISREEHVMLESIKTKRHLSCIQPKYFSYWRYSIILTLDHDAFVRSVELISRDPHDG